MHNSTKPKLLFSYQVNMWYFLKTFIIVLIMGWWLIFWLIWNKYTFVIKILQGSYKVSQIFMKIYSNSFRVEYLWCFEHDPHKRKEIFQNNFKNWWILHSIMKAKLCVFCYAFMMNLHCCGLFHSEIRMNVSKYVIIGKCIISSKLSFHPNY